RHVQVRRFVPVDAEHVDVELALVLDHRAAHPEAVVDVLLRAPNGDERAALAHRVVPETELRVVADGPLSWLRDDVDGHAPGTVVLRGELIARNADRSDLRLGRQRA